MKDTELVKFRDKYYSLGGILRRSQEIVLSGVSEDYVDQQDLLLSGTSEGNFVNISGDSMIGPLILQGDPSTNLEAATKQYVDSQVATVSGLAGGNYVSVSGDTMVGSLAITSGSLSIKTHSGFIGSDYIETTAAGQTTNAVPLALQSIAIEEGYAYWFESIVIGKKISPGISRLRLETNKGCINRDIGGNATLVSTIDTPIIRSLDADIYNIILSVSGNNLLTSVSGVNLETVNWVSILKYQKIG